MNGLLIFLSSSNRYRKLSLLSIIFWSIFMFCNANFSLGYFFPIVNLIVFIFVSNLTIFSKNIMVNKIYSVFSILIWSILVDTICYFIFPNMVFGQSIFLYVLNGLLFNFRYVIYNILYLFSLEIIIKVKNELGLINISPLLGMIRQLNLKMK